MTIRKDLKEVEPLISRLLAIGEEYRNKDFRWSHLKNNEDWNDFFYSIPDRKKRAVVERVYRDGRDMAFSLSDDLLKINFDLTLYPNLTSIVHKFEGGWVYEDLTFILEEAKKAASLVKRYTRAFNEMLKTFQEQVVLAETVKQILILLQNSDSFKSENGIPPRKSLSVSIAQVSNSNLSINSLNATQSININEQLFKDLLAAIIASDIEEKESLIIAAEEMKNANKIGALGETYKNFINAAASHMTVVASFIPALTALL